MSGPLPYLAPGCFTCVCVCICLCASMLSYVPSICIDSPAVYTITTHLYNVMCFAAPTSYTLTVTLLDSASQSVSTLISVTVLNANDPPVLSAGIATAVSVNENYLHPPHPAPSRSLSVCIGINPLLSQGAHNIHTKTHKRIIVCSYFYDLCVIHALTFKWHPIDHLLQLFRTHNLESPRMDCNTGIMTWIISIVFYCYC